MSFLIPYYLFPITYSFASGNDGRLISAPTAGAGGERRALDKRPYGGCGRGARGVPERTCFAAEGAAPYTP